MLLSVYKTDSDGFEVNNNLGTCYLLKKDYKNAVIYYEKAAKKSSDNEILSDSTAELSVIFRSIGDF